MTKHKYFIRMTPLSTFFFGGERTFTTAGGETNYFTRSNLMPQQTTVLGMIRFLIGNEKGFTPEMIGKHSFIPDSSDGFGIIEKLSPVFLTSKGKEDKDIFWLEAGYNHQMNDKDELIPFDFNNEVDNTGHFKISVSNICNCKETDKKIPNLKFDYKKYLVAALYNHLYPSELKNPADLFEEQFQVGNMKSYSGGADDDAFFKQVFYKLKKGYSFGVIVETKEDNELPFKKEIAAMGADQSLFSIEVVKDFGVTDTPFDLINKANATENKGCVVLLSDAYVDNTILGECRFAIADTTDFRNIITYEVDDGENKKTELYYNIDAKNQNPGAARKSSVKYNLLKRGTVLFAADIKAITKLLKNDSFYNIGYNYFEITN